MECIDRVDACSDTVTALQKTKSNHVQQFGNAFRLNDESGRRLTHPAYFVLRSHAERGEAKKE
jgi:hypothetical protein